MNEMDGQASLFGPDTWSGRTSPERSAPIKGKTLPQSSKKQSKSSNRKPPVLKSLQKVGLLGADTEMEWQDDGAWLGECLMRNTGESPSDAVESRLSWILEETPPEKYYLSAKACSGILTRAERRGKELPKELQSALKIQSDVSYTLDATDRHGVFVPGMCAAFKLGNSEKARSIGYSIECAPTLNAECGGNKPAILDMTHACDVIRDCGQIVPTLQNRMGTGGNQVPLVFDDASKPNIKCYNPWDSQSARIYDADGIFHSLNANENGGQSRDSVFVKCIGNGQTNQSYSDICGTLNAMHDQQAIIIDDIAAVDCRNGTENHDVNGTLQAKSTGGSSVNLQNVVRVNKLIRRLTPLECERLQGFPDRWTDIGDYIDGGGRKRKTSDSARYKALGNSIAIPPWTWVLSRICGNYDRPATMASLFDGIGGFPLIWERINGEGSCLWASEIEEFPMAVTRKRFGDLPKG